MKTIDFPKVSLSWKQKLILGILKDEFHGAAFGPQLLKESENKDIHELTINQITWNMLRLRDAGLVNSTKETCEGRVLNRYEISEYIKYDVIDIQ